jgi:hypothetical protein
MNNNNKKKKKMNKREHFYVCYAMVMTNKKLKIMFSFMHRL